MGAFIQFLKRPQEDLNNLIPLKLMSQITQKYPLNLSPSEVMQCAIKRCL